MGLIPGSGRSPGGRNGNQIQYSCLSNQMDKGAWRAMVQRLVKSDTIEHALIQAELDVQGNQAAAEDLTRALILSSGVQKE